MNKSIWKYVFHLSKPVGSPVRVLGPGFTDSHIWLAIHDFCENFNVNPFIIINLTVISLLLFYNKINTVWVFVFGYSDVNTWDVARLSKS